MSVRDAFDELLVRAETPCRCGPGGRCEHCLTAAEVLILDRNGGVGPHILRHPPSGELALCGGPGVCEHCERGR